MQGLYLTKAQFNAELEKCLHCALKPCQKACPVHCSPYDFIALAISGDLAAAARSIRKKNPLGHCCGLVCPDYLCQKACLRGKIDAPIHIPDVQAFILKKAGLSDFELPPVNGKKIAIVGSGPAGLGAAWRLLSLGYEVCIYEQADKIGGAMALIPDFRLPRAVMDEDWKFIAQHERISLCLNSRIDTPENLLKQGFDGVICAMGEQRVIDMNIEGEEHIVSYLDYLRQPNSYATAGKVMVVGGGNVAADCALTAKKLGAAEVSVLIRRKIFNMKVTQKEMRALFDNEIHLLPTTRLCKVTQENDALTAFTCSTQQTPEGYKDIENSMIARTGISLVIKAIGNFGGSVQDQPFIIYAGDIKTGASTVVEAAASGINAALTLHKNLTGEK